MLAVVENEVVFVLPQPGQGTPGAFLAGVGRAGMRAYPDGIAAGKFLQIGQRDALIKKIVDDLAVADVNGDVAGTQKNEVDVVFMVAQNQFPPGTGAAVPGLAQKPDGIFGKGPLVGLVAHRNEGIFHNGGDLQVWMLNFPENSLRERAGAERPADRLMEYYIEPDEEHEDFIRIAYRVATEYCGISIRLRDLITVSYAQPGKARISAPDVWDRRVEDVTPDTLREMAKTLIDACPVNIPRAQIRVSTNDCRVMNGNGVDCGHRSTLVYGHFTSMTSKDHPGEGMETYHGTHLDIDLQAIGESLARQANAAASSHEFKGSEQLTMILPPGQLGDMMNSSVVAAVNGENVKYGRSMWKDALGQQVASEQLTIVDDPTVPAPLSCVFDDEGTPTERRVVVENGVLRSFLRDSFCGDSTGNGMRRSSVEAQGAYERTPVIKALNVTAKPGMYTPEQIIEQTDRGIFVERFAWPEADEMTGRFGLNVRCGYIIRNGEVVDTINNALLMGNMLEAVRNVELIGNDSRQMGVVTVPTMSFSGTELVGN